MPAGAISHFSSRESAGVSPDREPDIDRAHADAYARLRDLGKGEHDLIIELRERYAAGHTAAWLLWAEAVADMQAEQSAAVKLDSITEYTDLMDEGIRAGKDFDRATATLRQTFFDDMRLFVLHGDLQVWAAIERYNRRQLFLYQEQGRGGVIEAAARAAEGEGIANAIGQEAELVLDRYAREFDPLIIEMNATRDRLTEVDQRGRSSPREPGR